MESEVEQARDKILMGLLDRLVTLEISVARRNDKAMLALQERGFAECRNFRWYPTDKGREALDNYKVEQAAARFHRMQRNA